MNHMVHMKETYRTQLISSNNSALQQKQVFFFLKESAHVPR